MKEGAEKVELKIQAKVESLKTANEGDKGIYKGMHVIYFCFRLVWFDFFLSSSPINFNRVIIID